VGVIAEGESPAGTGAAETHADESRGARVPGASPSAPPGASPAASLPGAFTGGRPRRPQDPLPWYDFEVDRASIGLRMMTPAELERAVVDLTGVKPDVSHLPSPLVLNGIDNDATQLRVRDVLHLKNLLHLATDVASRAAIDKLIPCQPAADGCTAAEIGHFVRQALFVPISQATADRYHARYRQVLAAERDEPLARRAVLQAVLFSADFLYRTEIGSGRSGGRLDPHELAAKLSIFLWGTRPDARLRDLAASGALLGDAVFDAEVDRHLRDARAEIQVQRLLFSWLGLDDLDLSRKSDAAKLPPRLQEDMLSEIKRLVHDVFAAPSVEQQSLHHLLTLRQTWVSPSLAGIYGLPGAGGGSFQKVSLDAAPGRRGILTSPAVLAAHAKELGRSPMQRGRFLVGGLACHQFAPEAGDPVMLLKDEGAATLRDSFKVLEQGGSCSYCHQALNAGFAFDVFDFVGRRYPATFVSDAETYGSFDLRPYDPVVFTNTIEAVEGLAAHRAVSSCLIVQAFRLAQGRLPGRRDRETFAALEAGFRGGRGSLVRLMSDIARSPSFRSAR
jgi:hypothetical protein